MIHNGLGASLARGSHSVPSGTTERHTLRQWVFSRQSTQFHVKKSDGTERRLSPVTCRCLKTCLRTSAKIQRRLTSSGKRRRQNLLRGKYRARTMESKGGKVESQLGQKLHQCKYKWLIRPLIHRNAIASLDWIGISAPAPLHQTKEMSYENSSGRSAWHTHTCQNHTCEFFSFSGTLVFHTVER